MGRSVKHMFGIKSESGKRSSLTSDQVREINYNRFGKRFNKGTGNKNVTGVASAVKGVKNKPKTYSFKKAKYRDVTKQPKPSFMGPFTMKYGKGKSSFPFGG